MARNLHHSHHHHHHHAVHSHIDNAAAAVDAPIASVPNRQSVFDGNMWQHVSNLVQRSSGSDSTSSDSSSNGDGTDKPSFPVAAAVVIPIVIIVVAIIILFTYLHRRHLKRLRREDANDPHKSLDFGWDADSKSPAGVKGRRNGKKAKPDMSTIGYPSEKSRMHDRGLSMDMDLGSPYLIPPDVHGSRESLHSISRTIHSQDDRYRPATSTYMQNDAGSIRSQPTRRSPDGVSGMLGPTSLRKERSNESRQPSPAPMLNRMSAASQPIVRGATPTLKVPEPAAVSTSQRPMGLEEPSRPVQDPRDSFVIGDDVRKSNNYLGAFIRSGGSSVAPSPIAPASPLIRVDSPPPIAPPKDTYPATTQVDSESAAQPREIPLPLPSQAMAVSSDSQPAQFDPDPVQTSDLPAEPTFWDESSEPGDHASALPAQAIAPHDMSYDTMSPDRGSSQEYMPDMDDNGLGLSENDFNYDNPRYSMGVRPLPPDDPMDNPEQRANRIRSFYKEYFDESKPEPAGGAYEYYEDYDENYLGDGAIYDEATGDYYTAGAPPYQESYGRRAMTPPPRIGGRRHAATMSNTSRSYTRSPRAFSSISGQFGPPSGRRGPPKKRMPPPAALRILPTPHMLKEDAFALPIDFAPPSSVKDRQAGRPDSPRGGLRPYSPAIRAHTPLATSYDDLAAMPSPHLLRKSGTFTGLDFAPPPRFRNGDTASDAGSIRSNRSGMSARSQYAVRTGAYRVSRIPESIVGTKTNLMDSLKPQWNMHNNTGTIGMPV